MTPAEIIASANVTDPERFRYEVESKANYVNEGLAGWPNMRNAFDHYSEWIIISNSDGKDIACLKLKAWK